MVCEDSCDCAVVLAGVAGLQSQLGFSTMVTSCRVRSYPTAARPSHHAKVLVAALQLQAQGCAAARPIRRPLKWSDLGVARACLCCVWVQYIDLVARDGNRLATRGSLPAAALCDLATFLPVSP